MLLFPLVALFDLPFLPHSIEGFVALLLLHLSDQQKFVFVPLKKNKRNRMLYIHNFIFPFELQSSMVVKMKFFARFENTQSYNITKFIQPSLFGFNVQ